MIILSESNSDKLVISFNFPPNKDISGIVVAKRIINDNSKVDVIHNVGKNTDDFKFDFSEDFIDTRFATSIDSKRDSIECIFNFINQGLNLIDEKDYKEIYSRSWLMANHYLALEYKFRHPDVFWVAEFSDPVLKNMKGEIKSYKSSQLNDEEFINRANLNIKELDNDSFKLLDNPNNTFYLAEYLTFLFSDEIIFTNENQRKIMLEGYDDAIKQLVISKSKIIPHPTLDEKYYHLSDNSIKLNEDDINLAYFGKSFYTNRHFEALFFAFESLNHKYKSKIKFHLFINRDEFLDTLINDLEFKENIIVRKPLDYLEFLNCTLNFDILLITDTITKDYFSVNPYLPSKLSDYLGSNKDIWAIYEKGSTLSSLDLKYKSDITDFKQSADVLLKILNDYGYADSECSFDYGFYERRINQLNRIIRNENKISNQRKGKISKLNRENKRLSKRIKKLNDEKTEILSSTSWKITAPFRKLFSFIKR